ncbi:hypothetical protein KM043_018460 [Ampulex compressa]|nr:hypothetical protein KM043_018460 [Ampulex compressa]
MVIQKYTVMVNVGSKSNYATPLITKLSGSQFVPARCYALRIAKSTPDENEKELAKNESEERRRLMGRGALGCGKIRDHNEEVIRQLITRGCQLRGADEDEKTGRREWIKRAGAGKEERKSEDVKGRGSKVQGGRKSIVVHGGTRMGVERLIAFSGRLANKEGTVGRLFVEADQLAERLRSTFTLPAAEPGERLPVSYEGCAPTFVRALLPSVAVLVFLRGLLRRILFVPSKRRARMQEATGTDARVHQYEVRRAPTRAQRPAGRMEEPGGARVHRATSTNAGAEEYECDERAHWCQWRGPRIRMREHAVGSRDKELLEEDSFQPVPLISDTARSLAEPQADGSSIFLSASALPLITWTLLSPRVFPVDFGDTRNGSKVTTDDPDSGAIEHEINSRQKDVKESRSGAYPAGGNTVSIAPRITGPQPSARGISS